MKIKEWTARPVLRNLKSAAMKANNVDSKYKDNEAEEATALAIMKLQVKPPKKLNQVHSFGALTQITKRKLKSYQCDADVSCRP